MHGKINQRDLKEWHSWFAWYPVQTEDGYWVWLELVWRRVEYSTYDVWNYYSLKNPNEDPYGADRK